MTWDSFRLSETLAQLRAFGDDTTLVECKTAKGGIPADIGETLCAFANMPQTGSILLGVSESLGFVVTGVDDPSQMEKSVVNVNRNSVDPAPQLHISHLAVDGKAVVAIDVMPLLPQEKPARYQKNAYLRQADGDYVMNSNDLRMLSISALNEPERVDYDFAPLPSTGIELLDQSALEEYLKTIRSSRSRLANISDHQQLLQMTNVCDTNGNLRLGGLYALGYLPQAFDPALGATAAVRLTRDGRKGRNQNLVELEGPLPAMLEAGMAWVQQNTTITSRYNDHGHLVDTPEFPPSAIREVLANALVHRDLGPSLEVGKKVEIRVTERSLVVSNPGGLRGVTRDQLLSSSLTKAPVNKRLYEIARYLRMPDGQRVIEGEGGGIQEILTVTREARLPEPRFIDTGVEFKVIFPRGSRFSEEDEAWLSSLSDSLTPTEEDLLVTLRTSGPMSIGRLGLRYVPMSQNACVAMVDKLESLGVVSLVDDIVALADGATGDHPSIQDLSSLGVNVPALFEALSSLGDSTVHQLSEYTGLSVGQVRYALDPLITQGYAKMNGGQGSRRTTYSLTTRV
ncbi:ATP-binding protein [Corynebacterium cystitidis]|uniref:ATP-dependent DNA helicase RecG n=1 Tax=Corynebacterium cystitidis DSM 20524 TaxID=1121357 RepID=A0A1H9TCY6_9CORY|nr:ATP-binding protein [Corynebacterium cystitidis]WJY83566.1 Divergent AAA domain protein [Corynebacterium cystitidis DSM 20524]SER95082.1 ATP-dependent DNA helicase RecG [Corynebacterium cystitidis DSM 20524]SNV92020.1 putative transcriptional regulator [Corynebacterium cystitidis]